MRIRTSNKAANQNLVIDGLTPLLPSGGIMDRSTIPQDINFPAKIDAKIKVLKRSLRITWASDAGTTGSATVFASHAGAKSELRVRRDVRTWAQFRDYAMELEPRRFIFRGQDCVNRLRTSFHRTRRKDVVTFLNQDMPNVHHMLTAQTKHLFNLLNPMENAAFLNLIQHHGYPTPLLDWSHSPFVAAFFAYRRRRDRRPRDNKVRIFVFDKARWNLLPQFPAIAFAQPHFSLIEALTIENPRAMPQQAVSSITNMDDIEGYISSVEAARGQRYLEAIDLPSDDRRMVMEQLSMMGITAGSLFPGLDGACEELRGRYFHPFAANS